MNAMKRWWDERSEGEKVAIGVGLAAVCLATDGAAAYAIATHGAVVTVATGTGATVTVAIGKAARVMARCV